MYKFMQCYYFAHIYNNKILRYISFSVYNF